MLSGARALALAAVVAGALVGCGTSRVITNVPDARIYVDGERVGQDGEFRRRGMPGSTTVLVMAPDGRRKRVTIGRDFTLVTGLLGMITYGVGWFAFWEYPETVVVNLEQTSAEPASSGWDDAPGGTGDPWQDAPPGWQEPVAPTPAAEEPAPAAQAAPAAEEAAPPPPPPPPPPHRR